MKEFFLKTERLEFSIWTKADINDALELWGNPNVTKYIAASGMMIKEEIYERLKKEEWKVFLNL